MGKISREEKYRMISVFLSVVLLLCLLGTEEFCYAPHMENFVQTTSESTRENEWIQKEAKIVNSVLYVGNILRIKSITAGKLQRNLSRQEGRIFFVVLFVTLLKVTAISCCILFLFCWICVQFYRLPAWMARFIHLRDGKKKLIPIFLQ